MVFYGLQSAHATHISSVLLQCTRASHVVTGFPLALLQSVHSCTAAEGKILYGIGRLAEPVLTRKSSADAADP